MEPGPRVLQDARPTSAVTTPVLEVVAAPIVGYAMAHGGIGFLHRVVVALPTGSGDAEDLVVRVEVRDADRVVLTRPWQHHVDSLRTGVPLVLDNPAVRLDAGHLAELEEETTAEIVVTVTVRGVEVATTHTPVRVLAARQWSLHPDAPVLSLELLASFVQPTHPAVGPLVGRAAALLAGRTDSGSLQVAHVAPERIDAIVDAVLSWHYRSHDEALIAFSNATSYEGRLSSFPTHASAAAGHHDTGLSLTRVPGAFVRSASAGQKGMLAASGASTSP
jgi:hypothetical protein